MAISVRERIGELAVLKAIGFSDRTVLFFVLAESLIIALFGGLLGLALRSWPFRSWRAALNGLLPTLILSPAILSSDSPRLFSSASSAGLLPGIGAMRMRVVNALRRV